MLVDVFTNTLSELLADIFGVDVKQLRDKHAIHRELTDAIQRAEKRFREEYRAQDAELVDVLTVQTRFADLPSVKTALRQLLEHPFREFTNHIYIVQRSFTDVLPEYTDRSRVDAALSAFLSILGQEVLLIPQLQQTYSLVFQRTSAESNRDVAANTAALLQSIQDLRADVQQLPYTIRPALPEPVSHLRDRPRPWHNLPRRTYSQFVGRHKELKELAKLMLPYPKSRHFAVTLDGIGGVGKSALALEFAHRHREHYTALSEDERFEAIVWVTAKRTLLTARGIQQRQQTFSTLADLYREIANVLEVPTILQVDMEQQRTLLERSLSDQRTLLVIDNLETVDDEELLTFIRELPDPTKVIVTTRHRIDIAMPIRVLGMPYDDACELMVAEAANRQIELTIEDIDNLFRRTAGVPLALVWSIALMSIGHSVEAVVRRLGSGHSDIARFCFAESVEHIRGRDAYYLLLTLAVFEYNVNRVMLGEVAGLGNDEIGRDDGLAELEQLSLINKDNDRFNILPLTRTFILDELKQQPALEQQLREKWISYLTEAAQVYANFSWWWRDLVWLRREGSHFLTLFEWSQQNARPDVLLQVLPGVLSYKEVVGHWQDVQDDCQIGLDTARLLNDVTNIIYIMNLSAWILSQQGRHNEAQNMVAAALHMSQEQSNHAEVIDILQTYSQILRRAGQFDAALIYCDQALREVRHLPPSQQLLAKANIQYEMGKIARDQGDYSTAHKLFVEAHSVFHEDTESPTFDLSRAWGLLSNLGFVAHHLGNLNEAAQMLEKALQYFDTSGSVGDVATVKVRLAGVEADRGNILAALTHAHKALELSKHLGLVQERAQAEAIIARLEDDAE